MSKPTAIVLAGSRPGSDPLAAAFGTDLKALVSVGGKPMVRWPVDALLDSGRFGQVRVLAQEPERIGAALPAHPDLVVAASGPSIAATLETLLFDGSVDWPLFVTTADHVLLDREMIDEFCDLSEVADIAVGVVERETLMARLPESQRTWIPFRSGAYSGANMFMLSGKKVLPALELWRSVEQDRKKAWSLLWALGPTNFLGAALRLRTIHQTLDAVGERLGAKVEAIDLSDPLAAVDVDKLADHYLVERLLAERTDG
ncbi:nucleotidyltransferase family protein [Sphingomonas sabuli]|uniref:Nucleotidyltransferase family protein n=1 Tax=Sphingomonas sabuli TaxID=2764186 RepID=A0A7G9L1B3_9SPHN|nr:nucleotidyltransferase family protein [Sphingomonas sabuli]QNM82412.1 nucleotidyltransferase family protein [Sphingomonas sabuli]